MLQSVCKLTSDQGSVQGIWIWKQRAIKLQVIEPCLGSFGQIFSLNLENGQLFKFDSLEMMETCQKCQFRPSNNPASDPQAAGTRNGRSVSVTGLPSHSSAGAHAWQQGSVCHNHTFLLAHRSTRTHDVPPASKWAAMPFYERDPRIIRRHMDVMAWVDQADAQVGKRLDCLGWVPQGDDLALCQI